MRISRDPVLDQDHNVCRGILQIALQTSGAERWANRRAGAGVDVTPTSGFLLSIWKRHVATTAGWERAAGRHRERTNDARDDGALRLRIRWRSANGDTVLAQLASFTHRCTHWFVEAAY